MTVCMVSAFSFDLAGRIEAAEVKQTLPLLFIKLMTCIYKFQWFSFCLDCDASVLRVIQRLNDICFFLYLATSAREWPCLSPGIGLFLHLRVEIMAVELSRDEMFSVSALIYFVFHLLLIYRCVLSFAQQQ